MNFTTTETANTVRMGELHNEWDFTDQDFIQMNDHGILPQMVEQQLEIFENGVSKTILNRPAAINDGILALTQDEQLDYVSAFEEKRKSLKLMKFVPASGAASRMFGFLNEFLNEFKVGEETVNAYMNRKNDSNLAIFLAGIEKFPFYETVKSRLKELYKDYYSMESHEKSYYFIKTMLSPEHFNFANKPKGVLPFHKYSNHIATPIEEQLQESTFVTAANGEAYVQFTISEDHLSEFEKITGEAKAKIEAEKGIHVNVDFSYQKKETDSIAVDMENRPFRSGNGQLLFRPAGHGSLIENLNDLDADVIFIKNIDNVIQDQADSNAHYKKVLAGILVELQQKVFHYLQAIHSQAVSQELLREMTAFAQEKLWIKVPSYFSKFTFENQILALREYFDRPIRVCGMVKNEGEPGGGPFWVSGPDGNLSLQIVETSQVDVKSKRQFAILQKATHFNPVDLVCGIKNYKGEKFDLKKYVDPDSGFIVEKNFGGKKVKSYELPGLWNGAMANWITIFVEVPLMTFNPVKTVNDLLKAAHQPQE